MRTRLALIAVILLAASHGRADEVALPFDHARPDIGLWVGTITPPGAGPWTSGASGSKSARPQPPQPPHASCAEPTAASRRVPRAATPLAARGGT